MDVIKHSWKYWKKIWPRMLIIVVAAVLMILLTLLTPQISQLIIDKVIYPALGQPLEQQNDSILDFLVAGFSPDNYVGICIMLLSCLGGMLLLQYVIHYFRWNFAHASNRLIANDIRHDAFLKYLNCSPKVLHSYSSGDMMNILSNDIDGGYFVSVFKYSHRTHGFIAHFRLRRNFKHFAGALFRLGEMVGGGRDKVYYFLFRHAQSVLVGHRIKIRLYVFVVNAFKRNVETRHGGDALFETLAKRKRRQKQRYRGVHARSYACLLYTSDAADEL